MFLALFIMSVRVRTATSRIVSVFTHYKSLYQYQSPFIIYNRSMQPQNASKPSIPFNQLTYLEFASVPQLFHQYLDYLLANDQINIIQDLFASFLMTLLEFSNHPHYQISYLKENAVNIGNIPVENLKASPLTSQLFIFLKEIMIKMPIGEIPLKESSLLTSYHPKVYFYGLIIEQIIKQKQRQLQAIPNRKQQREPLGYFCSLRGYYLLIELMARIHKGQKTNQQLLTKAIEHYQQNCHLLINTGAYEKYRQKYKEAIERAKYILNYDLENDKSMNQEERSVFINLQISQQMHNKGSIEKHIPEFYSMYETLSEKQQYLQRLFFEQILKHRQFSESTLQKFQFMLVYHINNIQQLQNKVSSYILLLTIKIIRNQETDIIQQFNQISNISKPSLQVTNALVYCLISVPQQTDISLTLEKILKSYPKSQFTGEQKTDTEYIKLVVLTLLMFRLKMKTINRKQLIDKILNIPEIIEYMGNTNILDFIVGLIFCGKELEINFGYEPTPITEILNSQNYESALRKIFASSYTNEANSFEEQSQLTTVLKWAVNRRLQVTQDVQSYFLQLICYFITNNQKMNLSSLIEIVKTLSQMTLISNQYCMKFGKKRDNENIEKMIVLSYNLLYWNLCVCGFYLEGFVCLELGKYYEIKTNIISYISIETQIKDKQYYLREIFESSSGEDYIKDLFGCLMNYDILEILLELMPDKKMISWANQWIADEQNYESVGALRNKKKLQIKRNRFMGLMWHKLVTQDMKNAQ